MAHQTNPETVNDCIIYWHQVARDLEQAANTVSVHATARCEDVNGYRQAARIYKRCAAQLAQSLNDTSSDITP